MFATRCAVALFSLTVLGGSTAAAQGRATMNVHARVEEVEPSRKSLQVALKLVGAAEGQIPSQGAPGLWRVTPHGAVTVRPVACGDDPCQNELITTIAFW